MRRGTLPGIVTRIMLPHLALAAALAPAGQTSGGPPSNFPAEVSFAHDVMALLSKAGCNAGACHGNKSGKGGFKLSLRGEDPEADYLALTRDQMGRRVSPARPETSLLLLKPTLQVPHEGGQRFALHGPEYTLLRDWIAGGMRRDSGTAPRLLDLRVEPSDAIIEAPGDRVSLRVTASLSDGSQRDVTRLAVFEPSNAAVTVDVAGVVAAGGPAQTTVVVRYLNRQVPARVAFVPARAQAAWSAPPPRNEIDRLLFNRQRQLGISPSRVCPDHVFLRRAYLDLLGLLPSAAEARAFAADADPSKRARVIAELLERPEFPEYWALKWSDLLRNEEKTLDRKGVEGFHAWIRASLATGKPLDQFIRELIAARGSTYAVPAANYYRALRDPFSRAETTAQLFLGVRLQCAKCHNHPFDRWTQDDYYGWASLFSRVGYRVIENRRQDINDGHEFDGEQIVFVQRAGEVADPRTGRPLPPRFLGAARPLPPEADRLRELANWVARPDNALFVRTQVNRVWYHLLGRGLVDPVDDFRDTNPASSDLLLQYLCDEFVASRFDLRHMIALIMNSATYQLDSSVNTTNASDEINFSKAQVARLTAEQLLDGLSQVLEVPLVFAEHPPGTRAGQLAGSRAVGRRDRSGGAADQFLRLFGKPPRLQSCECERSNEPTLSQAFVLTTGALMNDLLTAQRNRLRRLLQAGLPAAECVDELYWAAFSRGPSAEQREAIARFIETAPDARAALEDVAWAVVTSNEFLTRR